MGFKSLNCIIKLSLIVRWIDNLIINIYIIKKYFKIPIIRILGTKKTEKLRFLIM